MTRVNFNRDKAVQMYKDGLAPADISKVLDVSYQVVLRHLKKVGVYPRPEKKDEKKVASKPSGLLSIEDVNSLSTSTTPKTKSTKRKTYKTREVTMEEKIEYCNKKYGVGKWHFMTKEEFTSAMILEQEKRALLDD